jgi:CspA family cold shock protein
MNGQIKRLVKDKGFGFLVDSDGTERFFHSSEVKNSEWPAVREGDRVTFDPNKGPKGDRAVNVHLLD